MLDDTGSEITSASPETLQSQNLGDESSESQNIARQAHLSLKRVLGTFYMDRDVFAAILPGV